MLATPAAVQRPLPTQQPPLQQSAQPTASNPDRPSSFAGTLDRANEQRTPPAAADAKAVADRAATHDAAKTRAPAPEARRTADSQPPAQDGKPAADPGADPGATPTDTVATTDGAGADRVKADTPSTKRATDAVDPSAWGVWLQPPAQPAPPAAAATPALEGAARKAALADAPIASDAVDPAAVGASLHPQPIEAADASSARVGARNKGRHALPSPLDADKAAANPQAGSAATAPAGAADLRLVGFDAAAAAAQQALGAKGDPAAKTAVDDRVTIATAGVMAGVAGALADGAAPASTLPSRLSAPPGSPDFASQLGTAVSVFVRQGVQHARLELNPAEMGPLTLQIRLDGDRAQIHMAAEHGQTRQALEQSMPQLASSLREAGLTLAGGGVFEQPPRQPPLPADWEDQGRRDRSRAAGAIDDGDIGPTTSIQQPVPLSPLGTRRGMVDLVA